MAGYFEKRGKSKYRLVVDVGTDFKGKRLRKTKTVTCKSDRQAEKELAKFYAECSQGVSIYSDKALLSTLCDKYIEDYAATKDKKSTLAGYKSIIHNNIKPLIGALPVGKITPLHIQEWINYLNKEKALSPKTLRNCYSLLHNIFDAIIKWGFASTNPCVGVSLPAKEKKEAAYYNEQQISVLIERTMALDVQYLPLKASIILALFSGLRMGELAGLRWEDVNMLDGEIFVRNNRLYSPGYGTYDDSPKTSSSVRKIAIPNLSVDLLRQLRKQQLENRIFLGQNWGDDKGYVFLSDFGNPLHPSQISKRFAAFVKKEKLPHLTLHGLRHTHTSMLAHMGLDMMQVSKRLGHSQLSTTQNIYTHLFKDTDKEIANHLDERFATILPPMEKSQRNKR